MRKNQLQRVRIGFVVKQAKTAELHTPIWQVRIVSHGWEQPANHQIILLAGDSSVCSKVISRYECKRSLATERST